MKTIVRATVITPDCRVTIQRLYDMGTFFRLETEVKTGHQAADFIDAIRARGGKKIDLHKFIDDDDLQPKWCATYEYIRE